MWAIKTQPNEAGSDPNINNVIKFNVKNSNEIFNKFQNENIQLERMNSQNYDSNSNNNFNIDFESSEKEILF